MERFVKNHVEDHPEVAGYATALTSPLRTLRMYAAPSLGEESPFEVRDELPVLTPPALVLAGRHDFSADHDGPTCCTWAWKRPN
jgi:proline iminopeptidase